MQHADYAAELFTRGYNCAQAVLCAFCDVTGLDEETSLRLASSFGGGMGGMREVCGAVSAMFMIAGLLYGGDTEQDDGKKKAHYALIREIAEQFKERNQHLLCRNLLAGLAADTLPSPSPRTEQYYKTRPCVRFVMDAAHIIDSLIAERGA